MLRADERWYVLQRYIKTRHIHKQTLLIFVRYVDNHVERKQHFIFLIIFAGADGVIQAMMLSFGALRFSNDHLEFGTHPSDLHRDYFFRRINYGNDTHVNISVVVNEENKAMLYVSLDRNNRPYYACNAGCVDTPIQLRYGRFKRK